MKKHIYTVVTIMLLTLFVLSSVSAESYNPADNDIYTQVGEPFVGTNGRVQGMGGAGLGVKGYHDSFLFNPANLAGSGFKLSLPSVTVTLFNAQKVFEDEIIEDFLDGSDGALTNGGVALLNTIKDGYGDVLTTDVSTTFTLGGFGLSIQAQERVMSHKLGGVLGTDLIAQVTTAATLGYGLNFNVAPKVLNIDVGVSVQAVYKAYLEAISGKSILDLADPNKGVNAEEKFLNETPFIAGWAVPISIGANFNFPFGLSVSAVARNINGTYYMTTYASANEFSRELFGTPLNKDHPPASSSVIEEWEMESPWGLDFGFTWAPRFLGNMVQPTIAIDVVDVASMGGKEGEDLTRAFFEQTRLGASVRLLSLLDIRYGINKGYQSIGIGFDLLVFHIDANYYTLEYGASLGDKPIDALSLRFSIGTR